MSGIDFLLAAPVAAAVVFGIWRMIQRKGRCAGCNGRCAGCSAAGCMKTEQERRQK